MQKLMRENLKVPWAEFSTQSKATFVMSVVAMYRQAQSNLELNTRPRFLTVSLSCPFLVTNAPSLLEGYFYTNSLWLASLYCLLH